MSKDRVVKIDMDFEDGRRDEVIQHIKDLYGEDHVSNIITFGTLAAKQVLRDVGRVLEVDLNFVNALCKTVPAEPKMTLEKAFKVSPDFKQYYDTNADAKKIIDIALKLEGLSRQKSQHACGK
jgi:DNA polymerase-3 subunit alpha